MTENESTLETYETRLESAKKDILDLQDTVSVLKEAAKHAIEPLRLALDTVRAENETLKTANKDLIWRVSGLQDLNKHSDAQIKKLKDKIRYLE